MSREVKTTKSGSRKAALQSEASGLSERLDALKVAVLAANLELVRQGLAILTFGNASGIDRVSGTVIIKPSGVEYAKLRPEDMVCCDLSGKVGKSSLRPSSDLATHLHLYREFPEIGGVVHTHSNYATSWAQAGRAIPVFGTTHADYFYGAVPVTEELSSTEIGTNYEENTGKAITRVIARENALRMPVALVRGHAPFCWGRTPSEAVHHAVLLEEVARMAWQTVALDAHATPISQDLLDRHYLRKHGAKATYGQGEK